MTNCKLRAFPVLASFLDWFVFELEALPVTKSDIDSDFAMTAAVVFVLVVVVVVVIDVLVVVASMAVLL